MADPNLTCARLAARFGTSPESVRGTIVTLRAQGLLPPAPPRPLFSPTTIRGRLLALIHEQPGISGKRAAMLIGTAQSCVLDALWNLRKRKLIAPFDPDRHGCYPLPSTPPQEPLMPDPTPATMRDVVVAIAEALGLDEPEETTEEDILQAAKHQTETVTRLIDEKRRMNENLEINRRLLSSVEAHVSRLTGEMDRLRSELAARPVLTREELKERLDDLAAADEVEEEAEELRAAAETGRRAAFGLDDLDADDLRALADLRLARSRKLHQRALGGR